MTGGGTKPVPFLGSGFWGPESAQDYRTRALAAFDFIPFQGSRTSNWPADWNPPSSHPWSKTAAADPTGRFEPPDDIWNLCGIQFQVIRAFKLPQPPPLDNPCAAGNAQLNNMSMISQEILTLVGASEHALIFDPLFPIIVSFGYPNCGNWYGQWTHATVEIDLADSSPRAPFSRMNSGTTCWEPGMTQIRAT